MRMMIHLVMKVSPMSKFSYHCDGSSLNTVHSDYFVPCCVILKMVKINFFTNHHRSTTDFELQQGSDKGEGDSSW
jgi:hypothetical protein